MDCTAFYDTVSWYMYCILLPDFLELFLHVMTQFSGTCSILRFHNTHVLHFIIDFLGLALYFMTQFPVTFLTIFPLN